MTEKSSSVTVRVAWLAFFALVGLFVSGCVQLWCGAVSTNAQRWLLLLQTVLTFGLPALLFWHIFGEKTHAPLCSDWRMWLIIIALIPCALPAVNLTKWLNDMLALPHFMSGIEQWMRQMEAATGALTEQLLQTDHFGDLAVNLLVMAVAPAIAEELFFRGSLQKTLAQAMNAHAAIWLTAAIFSAVHLQFYGFVPRMLLGAALGYLFWLTGSIWPSVVAHFVNNALTIVLFKADLPFDIDAIGTGATWWLGAMSLVVTCGLVWSIQALLRRKRNEPINIGRQ